MRRSTFSCRLFTCFIAFLGIGAVLLNAGCQASGSVPDLWVQQNKEFNEHVVPELLDGYNTNPNKTESQKANITAATHEHVQAVDSWATGP